MISPIHSRNVVGRLLVKGFGQYFVQVGPWVHVEVVTGITAAMCLFWNPLYKSEV